MEPTNTQPDPAERIENGKQEFEAMVKSYGLGELAPASPIPTPPAKPE